MRLRSVCLRVALSVAALAATLLATGVHAQTLHPRWYGSWKTDGERLVISAEAILRDTTRCRWLPARPRQAAKGCVAFYEGTISTVQVKSMLDEAERDIRRQGADRGRRPEPAERKRMADDLARYRTVLRELSNDVFRAVILDLGEDNGDCGTAYFLDRESVFAATSCPYPEANSLRRFSPVR